MSIETEGFSSENEPKGLKQEYQELETLQAEFDQALADQDLEKGEKLADELEQRVSALEEKSALPVERELKLKEQYQAQVELLAEHHLIRELSNGERGIIGIDGKECPLPSYEEIRAALKENREMLEKKAEQGFSKLLLIPFGMPLDDLTARYKETLLQHDQAGTLLSTEGTELELDRNNPLFVWGKYQQADISGGLVYFPQSFDQNHQGKTKQELIDQGMAWEVILIEDLPDLPAQNQGETLGGRKQLEANQPPNQYLETIKQNPEYQNEEGLTPEGWLTYALARLKETNQQIDDYQGKGKICYNLGAYFPSVSYVPFAYFSRDYHQAFLYRRYPGNANSFRSVRPAVKICQKA